MKYTDYKEEDFVKDEYFQKWILDSDVMGGEFFVENWMIANPAKKETILKAAEFIRLMEF